VDKKTRSVEIDGQWYEIPDYRPERLNLSGALALFEDDLQGIKLACILNIRHIVASNPPYEPTGWPEYDEVREDLRKMRVAEGVKHYQTTLKRINQREIHKRNPYREKLTDEMIDRAREYPIDQLYDGHLRGPESGRRFGCCPFHSEKTGSFCIHPDNRWSCFGACGEHGDSIAFYQKLNGVSFPEAVKALQ
jgi:hypothetical protein